jgi:hypothetical protein
VGGIQYALGGVYALRHRGPAEANQAEAIEHYRAAQRAYVPAAGDPLEGPTGTDKARRPPSSRQGGGAIHAPPLCVSVVVPCRQCAGAALE